MTRRRFEGGPENPPAPAFFWRLIARVSDFLSAQAVGRTVEDPLGQIDKAVDCAVAETPWGLGQPIPEAAVVALQLPARPAFDALDSRLVQEVVRRAASRALVARFGRDCAIAVERMDGQLGLPLPLAYLRLRRSQREKPTIAKVVVGVEYIDALRHPWEERTLRDINRITVGVDPTSSIPILEEAARGVSRFHCWAEVERGRLMVHDGRVVEDNTDPKGSVTTRQPSTNGTALGGRMLPHPREGVEWPVGGKLVFAPAGQMAEKPEDTPGGRGVSLWLLELVLAEFSVQKAHDNGEFFTPSSLVQTIVNVIEPEHGIVFDPATGSAGMFVQSSHFIEQGGGDTMRRVVFYGQEKNPDTIRIAQMNLAVHGLEGKIAEAITYY